VTPPILMFMQQNRDSIFFIRLDITSADFQHYYANNVNSVVAMSHNGQRLQFPANVLRPFVTYSGVQGKFKLVIDNNSKFKSIDRIN